MSSTSSSLSREGSRDRDESRVVKHQHSFSESGRSSVPMWDSSDPDRAPPPLPLNPGTSGSPVTKPNTSARIEEAAALINKRALENAPSSYTSNAAPTGSPEKSLIKPQHRRMQSIQGVSVGKLSDSLERRSPDKGLRTPKLSEYEEYRASRSPERSPTRSGSETPTPSGRLTPSHLNRPILGENTPPSATMLALQTIRNRQESETPLANITNMSTPSVGRGSQPFDAISSQILGLTSIATNLQREMAQLSRRSKDNATDLMTLKDATTSRDEDIRKSLRDLVSGLDHRFTSIDTKLLTSPEASKSTPNLGLYLDNKPHNTSGPGRKNGVNLPRIPSPSSFSAALDRDVTASPSLVSDGAAAIALLEKVLREMGTKDGQENIITILESVKSQVQAQAKSPSPSRPTPMSPDPVVMKKLDEVLQYMRGLKENPAKHALVKASGVGPGGMPRQLDLYFDEQPKSGQLAKARRDSDNGPRPTSRQADFVNDEIMKMLKNVKQSVAQGGGLTNEVKALIRELRGEVLGMGREIARKLEQAEVFSKNTTSDTEPSNQEEIGQIVHSGLAELKEHMHQIVRDNRRQSAGSVRSVVDTQEVVHAVRSALAEMPQPRDASAGREELLASIKEAWEDCKPEIALEHFGLEREEILETLKEGLKSYQPQEPGSRDIGITYDDVLAAVRNGLADFKPPTIETEATATREEILMAVREVLENFDFGSAVGPTRSELSGSSIEREEILDAIKHGLSKQPPATKEVEFNREDLFDAIRSCLEGESNPLGGMGERVLDTMHDFLATMKVEFQQYSAANGKDTEQVLDAMKDGLEELRADIESYVDRAADVTGKDEIIDTVKAGFVAMQADLDKGFATRSAAQANTNTPELLDAMEKEFEHLRETIGKSLTRSGGISDKEEIMDALRDISDDRQSSLSSNSEDIVRLVKDELEHMRITLASTLTRTGASLEREDVLDAIRVGLEVHNVPRRDGGESILSNTSELLDAFQDGVDGIRADMRKLMDRPVDLSSNYEILDTLKAGIDNVRTDIEKLHEKQNDLSDTATTRGREVMVHDENLISTEIEGLKVMITQLRIKVEALDNMPVPPSTVFPEDQVQKDDLLDIHTAIKEVHKSVDNVRSAQEVPLSANAASKDDTDALETLLRNIKAKLDDLSLPDMDGMAQTVHLESIEDMLRDIKTTVEDTATSAEEKSISREDLTLVELLVKEIAAGVEEMQNKIGDLSSAETHITRADLQAVETLCLDTKVQIEELPLPDLHTLPTKEDIAGIKNTIHAFQEQIEAEKELTGQAFEARKVEHGGLATKIDDVKTVVADLRDELMSKLDGSEEGIVEIAKVLGDHHESMSSYATAAAVAELSDLVNKEFERHMDHQNGSRQLMDDGHATLLTKHEETSASLRSKIDDKFNDLMSRYDDAQMTNDAQFRSLDERGQYHLESTASTRAVVDDVKTLIDALGTTVTETCDRISDESRTVFSKVDDVNNRIGDLHTANAHDHGLTREEIGKTLSTAMRVEGSMHEHHPSVMSTLQQILGLVGQHFEHSREQTESFRNATDEIKDGIHAVPASIPPLLPPPPSPIEPLVKEVPVVEKYDDTQLHDKLNNLISHAAVAKEAFANIETHHQQTSDALSGMEKLDSIHEQVINTAGEVSAMVATQARLMAEHHDSKAAEATEAAIALEKRMAQKENVESDIITLSQEKEALVRSMAALKTEQEELATQTKRLTREVAKLETALSIRQEEMKDMDARAENLERRILEGVMNHARTVNINKVPKKPKVTAEDRDRQMSLKRVPSSASNAATRTSIKDSSSAIGSAVGMALKKRSPLGSAVNGTVSSRSSGVERRILSTSHVQGNRKEAPGRALMLAPAANHGIVSLKRSHSVRSNPSSYYDGRKVSWNGVQPALEEKENLHLDEAGYGDEGSVGDEHSDAGTERRTSFSGTSVMYTDTNSSMLYNVPSSLSMSGARTASYASSVGGTIDGMTGTTESIAEEPEEELVDEQKEKEEEQKQQDDEADAIMALLESPGKPDALEVGQNNSMALTTMDGLETPLETPQIETFAVDGMSDLQPPPRILTHADRVKYQQASDSGLGTEPPTADFERLGEAEEYFSMSRRDGGDST